MQLPGDDQPFESRSQLLEIQPHELKFTFEAKKQSSCAVHLSNISDHYVAFKVKTTSPKKYCVRPNIGVVKPKASCDITVTMQAQRSVPQDMLCKDKFLIQSTIAPFGISDEDITPAMFTKDSGKYFEECKLRVVLTSPFNSPILSPVNGVTKQEKSHFSSLMEGKMPGGAENLPPPPMDNNVKDAILVTDDVMQSAEAAPLQFNCWKFTPDKDVESKQLKDIKGTNLKVLEDEEELKSKIKLLDSKLIQAEFTITKLKEERTNELHGFQTLKQELALSRKKMGPKQVQRGFPPLFVCLVALLGLTAGYVLRAQ